MQGSPRISWAACVLTLAILCGSAAAVQGAVAPSTVSLQASLKTGNAPLTVIYTARVKLARGVTVKQYSWDFDGDGKADLTTISSPTVTYTYLKTGTFKATVSVTFSNNYVGKSYATIVVTPPSTAVAVLAPGAKEVVAGDVPVVVWVDSKKITLKRVELWAYDETTNSTAMVTSQNIAEATVDSKYTLIWQTNSQGQSGHRYYLFARAYTYNSATYLGSPTIYVTVNNLPSAQILTPAESSQVSGRVKVAMAAASAAPGVPLVKLELWATDETANTTGLITTLPISKASVDNKYEIVWDTSVQAVNRHRYYLFIKAYDSAGNCYTSASVYVWVRNTPSAVISAPENFATVSGVVPVVVDAVPASEDFAIRRIDLFVRDVKSTGNKLLESRVITVLAKDNKYTFNWDTNTQAVSEHRYEVFAVVYDGANNTYTTSSLYLVVNNTPGVIIISPKNHTTATGNVEVLVEACGASPNVPIKKLEFYGVDENVNTTVLFETRTLPQESADKHYKFTWNTNQQAKHDHRYYLYVVATDVYGNTSTSGSVYVTVKNMPSGEIIYPKNNDTVSAVVDVRVEARAASKDFPLKNIELWTIDLVTNMKKQVAVLEIKIPSEKDEYVLKWDTNKQGQNLRRYVLYAVLYDTTGNRYETTSIQVKTDNTPSAVLLAPLTARTLAGDVSVELEAHSASSQLLLTKFELMGRDHDTNLDVLFQTINLDRESADNKYKFTWDTNTAKSGHKYDLYVRAYDSAGNFVDTNVITVQVNNMPSLVLRSPIDSMVVTGKTDVRFEAHAASNKATIVRAEIWLQDAETGELRLAENFEIAQETPDGQYRLSWDPTKIMEKKRRYYFILKVYDSRGNAASSPSVSIMMR